MRSDNLPFPGAEDVPLSDRLVKHSWGVNGARASSSSPSRSQHIAAEE